MNDACLIVDACHYDYDIHAVPLAFPSKLYLCAIHGVPIVWMLGFLARTLFVPRQNKSRKKKTKIRREICEINNFQKGKKKEKRGKES